MDWGSDQSEQTLEAPHMAGVNLHPLGPGKAQRIMAGRQGEVMLRYPGWWLWSGWEVSGSGELPTG